MTAKKIATTLGTGTLGAGGAGAAAWNFGLFGGNGLEVNEVNGANQQLKEDPGKLEQSPAGPREPQEGLVGNRGNDGGGSQVQDRTSGGPGEDYVAPILHFEGATELDNKAINSSLKQDWSSTVSGSGEISVTIRNGDIKKNHSDYWRCELKPIIFGDHNSVDRSEFNRQGKELLEKIKNNVTQRGKFVKNCSVSRTESEQDDGGTGVIYLETEKIEATENKFKFKDQNVEDLITKDFTGVYKLGDDEEIALSNQDLTPKKDQGKVIFKTELVIYSGDDESGYTESSRKDWVCYISGLPENGKDFKDDKLKDILETFGSIPSEKAEKKKYILRNCKKNNKDIKGLKFREEGGNLKLDDKSLKDITEGMYENPSEAKP